MASEEPKGDEGVVVDPTANPKTVRAALATIVGSEQFSRAERLKNFISYVVEEAIAGRSDMILGKTIAQDVYGRDPLNSDNGENLVRVDAGRLRRKLEDYYETDGANERIRVIIEPGGYAPTFIDRKTKQPDDHTKSGASSVRQSITPTLAVLGLVAVLTGVFVWLSNSKEPGNEESVAVSTQVPNTTRQTERSALALKSAASVQALNLCDQARGFLFPIADSGNQKLAIDIFTKAIETDPGLPCGYAGAAHAAATLAILLGNTSEAQSIEQQATSMSRKATEMDPTNGWSQSAAAWAAYAVGQFENAEKLSFLAVQLAPNDGNVLDFRTTISLGLGNFEEALRSSDPSTRRDVGSFKFARRNLRAVAWFHAGKYDTAIQSLEDAIQNGDPVSALTLTYLAASHWAAGSKIAARKFADELKASWPEARPDIALSRLYSKEELSRQVVDRLVDAGWLPEN